MLQAVQRAELDALLQAAITPSPLGSLTAPLSTRPSSPLSGLHSRCSAVDVNLESGDSPLHPPLGEGG